MGFAFVLLLILVLFSLAALRWGEDSRCEDFKLKF